jgi:hypothetical protein
LRLRDLQIVQVLVKVPGVPHDVDCCSINNGSPVSKAFTVTSE